MSVTLIPTNLVVDILFKHAIFNFLVSLASFTYIFRNQIQYFLYEYCIGICTFIAPILKIKSINEFYFYFLQKYQYACIGRNMY